MPRKKTIPFKPAEDMLTGMDKGYKYSPLGGKEDPTMPGRRKMMKDVDAALAKGAAAVKAERDKYAK